MLSAATLDGSGSTDPDGDSLTYLWSYAARPGGSTAELDNATAVKPVFQPALAGQYRLRLVVNDGKVDSEPDTVIITAGQVQNTAPVANAGTDQAAGIGAAVALDGSGSTDADNDPLTFAWDFQSRPEGSAATLDNPNTANPTFTTDVAGEYVVRLVVNDGRADSAPDTVVVTANPAINVAPHAFAGIDRSVFAGATVQLDGSGSTDPEGAPLTYRWSLLNVPGASAAVLSSTTAVDPTFPADMPGLYVVQLIVNDGEMDSLPDTMTVEVLIQGPPTVLLKQETYTVAQGQTLTFDVGGVDPDGDFVALTAAPVLSNSTFSAQNGINATGAFTFTPGEDQPGLRVVSFTAQDTTGLSDTKVVTIEVTHPNGAPTVEAPAEVSVNEGEVLTIPVTWSDPDGDVVTATAAPLPENSVFLPSTGSITFAPDYAQAGEYTINCEASDGRATSGPRAVHVTVVDVPGEGPDAPRELNLLVNPNETPTLLKTARITGTINAGENPPPPATITSALVTSLSPAQGRQGETLDVTMSTGSSKKYETHFEAGKSLPDFGSGITVTSTRVVSASELVATVRIATDAPLGTRAPQVQTGSETALSVLAFNVLKGVTRVTGTLTDPDTGAPIAGATVTVQGTNITTTTDASGAFTLNDVPTGDVVIFVNPRDHRLIRIAANTASGEQVDLGAIESERTVYDASTPPSVNLFSVLARGFTEATGGMKASDAEQLVRDAMLLVGGDESGLIDDYGNQVNPAVRGEGLVSLTPSGVALLAQRIQRGGETVALADVLFAVSHGFEWTAGAPPTLAEWLDTLQQLVDAAWRDPSAEENRLVVLMFNKGDNVLFDPPVLGPDTRLNPLQAYMFMTSLWAEFTQRELEKAKPKTGPESAPLKAGKRNFTSFWRNAYSARNNFVGGTKGTNGIVEQAAINYLLYMNSLAMPMPGLLGMTMNLAARAPMAGPVFDQMTGAFGFAALANSLPDPPENVVGQMVKGGDGRVSVEVRLSFSKSHKKSYTELPAYLYSLYRYSTATGERTLVDEELVTHSTYVWAEVGGGIKVPMPVNEVASEEQWRGIRLALYDTEPLPMVKTPTGDVVQAPAATWFYTVTATEIQSLDALYDTHLAGKTEPWWTLPLTGRLDGLTPFVLHSRKARTSDYSAPMVLTVTSTGETVRVDEIEVDPLDGDVVYSDTKGGYIAGPTDQPAFYRIDNNGTGIRELFTETGFKAPGHTGLAMDRLGNMYTDNAASDSSYGGRLFRFGKADKSKTFTGSINYYSLDLQYANPVSAGPLAMGPGANSAVSEQDLYVVEKLSNSVRRAPVQASFDPIRRVAQSWASLPFTTEPLDLEVRDSGHGELLVHRIASAALGANVLVSDDFLMPNRELTVTVRGTNPTVAPVTNVMPLAPVLSDPEVLTYVSGPEPATANLDSYATQDFVFHYRSAASGGTRIFGQVQGLDTQGVSISSPQSPPDGLFVEVGCPIEFVSLEAKPEDLAPGGTITIKGVVANRGSTAFRDVTPTLVVKDTGAEYPGVATWIDGPEPESVRLTGSGSQEFVWHFSADELGEVTFSGKVGGVEEESGEAVLSRPYDSNKVLITPIEVELTVEPETILFKDDTIAQAHVSVKNTGGSTLKDVTPTLAQVSGNGQFEAIVALDAGPTDIPAGATKVFEFELRKPLAAGSLRLEATVTGTTESGKAIPATTDAKDIVIGPRIALQLYDVLLRINTGELGFDPAIIENRYPLADVVVRARPYPWDAHPDDETQGTSDAQGKLDLAVKEKRTYEVRAEIPLGIEGPSKEPLKIGFTEKIYALTDDVTSATIQVPKGMLVRTFELLDAIKEVNPALERFPLWGNELQVKVGYYELHKECTRILMQTLCKGEDTPKYEGIYSPGGFRQPMEWDAVPRLAEMLAFAKVRLDEASETTCNFLKSVLPAFWASRTGTALLDKTIFKTKREQFEQQVDFNTGKTYEMDSKKDAVGREMTLRIQKSVMSFVGFVVPPGDNRDEIIARSQVCVDWLAKVYWAVFTWKGLDEIAKLAAQIAVTEIALEGYLQPIYINTTTQPMLMEVVESVQQPGRIRGDTLTVLHAVADYDLVLRKEHKSRKAMTEAAQNTFGGAD
ncbi:MAG: PKD domain-containing protein, partial [FCB group bacterium]|nr:PKD domain-containing protein [FCB group bacterium]